MPRRMTEAEMLAGYKKAFEEGHIFPYYQPQYNHSTGRMIGAEALMRWDDPEFGMQSPADFIPVFEANGLIHDADLYMMERICRFLRKCLDGGVLPVPISFNISRYDIVGHDHVEELEAIRQKYDIPVKYLRAEITESSAIGGMELITSVLNKLHSIGYIVEMDDFGSGYSSLNVLKDLPVDMIKLDMRFLSADLKGRGGIIIGSMVQMAKWLNSSTIAEGVETIEQADFMKSIGCSYVQGYLYSRPIPEDAFMELLKNTGLEKTKPLMKLIDEMDVKKFWSPESLETLIFSNYVGAASVFTYYTFTGKAEILRVNAKYIKELGMNMSEQEMIHADQWEHFDEANRKIFEDTIKRAIVSGEEESCETWRRIRSKCCGEDAVCIKSFLRVIGSSEDQVMIYAMVQNITSEKKMYQQLYDNEKKFGYAIEHANAYAWEYDIATKDMFPCSRCRRELGLPAVIHNYPEPLIESGFFPAEIADMYRDWHKQLANGAKSLDAVMPLTQDRIPFRVQYTAEFDENGRPLKAFGSAALVT